MNQQRERVQREMVDIRNLGMILFQNHVIAEYEFPGFCFWLMHPFFSLSFQPHKEEEQRAGKYWLNYPHQSQRQGA